MAEIRGNRRHMAQTIERAPGRTPTPWDPGAIGNANPKGQTNGTSARRFGAVPCRAPPMSVTNVDLCVLGAVATALDFGTPELLNSP